MSRLDGFPQQSHETCVADPAADSLHQQPVMYGVEVTGVSLDIENYCTLRLLFDLSTLAGLSRRNLPEAGIRLLFQI